MIRFENITKSYGDNRVIADLNFEIAKGEFFVLIGPSGSGNYPQDD
jgi:osmoprotectant transport system ATP-binding protein